MVGMIKTALALLARVTVFFFFFFHLRRLMLLLARKNSGGRGVMYSRANLRFITNSITTARLARAVAFFCSMRVFTDGVLSAGSSEEAHSVWNKVLALRCHVYAGPWLRDHKCRHCIWRGWHCRVASLALDILCEDKKKN